MIDSRCLLAVGALAGYLAATVVLLCAWPWREPRPRRTSAGAVLGVALGWYAGCWLLHGMPEWPPTEDRGRLLLVLIPALLVVELLAVVMRRPLLVWPLRLLIAAAAGRVLLHNTVYITDLAGPGTRQWPPLQTLEILGGLAAALAGVWALLALLARRAGGSSVVLSVALTCAGATATIMLSGYATINEYGLPLAGALAGTALATLFLPEGVDLRGVLGVGVVGLFALLVVGRFFGKLSTAHALLLGAAPLLGWLPELPLLRRAGLGWRGSGRIALGAGLVALALMLSWKEFTRSSTQSSRAPSIGPEPTVDDYMNFGK